MPSTEQWLATYAATADDSVAFRVELLVVHQQSMCTEPGPQDVFPTLATDSHLVTVPCLVLEVSRHWHCELALAFLSMLAC